MPPKRKLNVDNPASADTDSQPSKTLKTDDKDKDVYVNNNNVNNSNGAQCNGATTASGADGSPSKPLSTPTPRGNLFPLDSKNRSVRWAWYEDEFTLKAFIFTDQEPIENLYQKNKSDSTLHQISNFKLKFSDMTCIDSKGEVKKLNRTACLTMWFWEKSRTEREAFAPEVSREIEEKYQSGSSTYAIDSERFINFDTCEQIRFDDAKKKRRVSRALIDTNIEIDHPTWYYVQYDSTFTPQKWEIYPDTIEIEKSFQTFLTTGKPSTYKSTTGDTVHFFLIHSKNPSKFNNAELLAKRDSGNPMIVPITKRTYSQLSEDEKKEIILKTLNGTLSPPDQASVAPAKKTDTVSSQLYMPEEEDILKSPDNKVMKYILRPCRQFSSSAADMHFRTAESQFYRLLNNNSSRYKVIKVEYIVNPTLMKKFNAKQEEFKKSSLGSNPVFGFHGTSEKNIYPICKTNFSLSKVGSTTDSGYYGSGVYFSEYPEYSIDYISDCSKIMLCKVLLGKSYKCTGLIMGQPCTSGYNSHLSPDEMEVVIFDSDQILPLYIVHYDILIDTFAYHKEYNAAQHTKPSNVLSGLSIGLVGTLADTQTKLTKLVQAHGGSVDKKGNNNYIVTNRAEYKKGTNYIADALSMNVPVVTEAWLYNSITSGSIASPTDFGFTFQQDKNSTNDIKAYPLEYNEGDPLIDTDSKDDDKPKKPMCKYGRQCYRKNAQHFKEFSHEFLVD